MNLGITDEHTPMAAAKPPGKGKEMKAIKINKELFEIIDEIRLNRLKIGHRWYTEEEYENTRNKIVEREVALRIAVSSIQEEIDLVQKRSSVRQINAVRVVEALYDIEKGLSIPKSHMDGVLVTCDLNAQNFPGKYKGTPESTQFKAVYKSGSWRLENIYRKACKSPTNRIKVELTEEAKQAVLERISKGIF